MHVNPSRAKTSSHWCGVVVRRGGCQFRCRPRHLTMVQNYVVRRQNPRVAEQCNVNIQSIEYRKRQNISKCTILYKHGGTLNIRRAASPLVWVVEEEKRWETSDQSQGVRSQDWSGNEPNRTVALMVLKATVNDRCAILSFA
ncbi:hypothetical protein TNCV_1176141 [Trichonephila clavipes]|nr:hypothetical protein TNCV_1176141 [Trichonephila clavipes]